MHIPNCFSSFAQSFLQSVCYAFANREQYRLQLLINDIDLIIYNNTTKLLFCRDEEIL